MTAANQELENFTYSVAHDLRAPLRSIGGFARVLLEDYPDKLDEDGQRYLNIIHQDARKMGQLIDDLLALARLGRKEMSLVRIDMAELAKAVFDELKAAYPERKLQIEIQPLPPALGDRRYDASGSDQPVAQCHQIHQRSGPGLDSDERLE